MPTRKVYVGMDGGVYEAPKNLAEMAGKVGNVKISPPIDVLEANFSPATIRSIKQVLAGKYVDEMSSDEDITKWLEEFHGKESTWKG